MTDNIKKNKNQHNDAIEHELRFDNKFNLYEGTKELLQVVAISLRGGKKKKRNDDLWLNMPVG